MNTSYINWSDIIFQFGWLVLLCAIGFVVYKIVKIRRINKHLNK